VTEDIRSWNFNTQVLALYSLEKRRLRRHLIKVYKYLIGKSEDLTRLISVMFSESAKEMARN